MYDIPAFLLHLRRSIYGFFQALERPSGKDTETALEKTKSAISVRIDQKSVFPRPAVSIRTSESEYIKYTPATQASGHQLGATERLIKMHKAQNDPLEPPRFRHKKVGGSRILSQVQCL